jgi:hypothetical protein
MKGRKGRDIKVILGGKGEGGRGTLVLAKTIRSGVRRQALGKTGGVTYIHGTSTEDQEIQ